ncbi:TolC family protein [Candidatus Margulisiibacteriota bacterium]
MKKLTLILLMFFLMQSMFAYAEPQKLVLNEYLQAIKANDPAYQAIFHEKNTAAGLLKSVQAMYDTYLFAGYSYGEQGPSTFGSFSVKDGKNTMWTMGGSKKLKATGTELSATFMRTDTSATYEVQPQDVDVITNKPSLGIRIAQPLWKDFMGILSRIPVERMEIQADIAELSEAENEETYYEAAISLYYDWLSLTLALNPLKESYANAQALLKQVKKQYRNDVALKTDLLRSQEAVWQYQNALEETLYNWNQVGSELYRKMGQEFTPAASWEELPVEPEVKTDFCKCDPEEKFKNIRPIMTLEKLLSQFELDVEESKRKELPELSVYGEVSDYKEEDKNTDSFSSLNSRDTKVGFDFSMSLDNSEPKGILQQAEENISKTKEDLEDTRTILNTLYNNYLLKVKAWGNLEKTAKAIADSSEERLKLETRRYRSGKTKLKDVADYRNQFAANETDYLNKMIELAKLEVQIASLNDDLLDKVQAELAKE